MNHLKGATELRGMFKKLLTQKLKILHIDTQDELNSVYTELTCKVGHTRIQEYIDSFKQTSASRKGNATLVGQNLRDSLFSEHVNVQSQSK